VVLAAGLRAHGPHPHALAGPDSARRWVPNDYDVLLSLATYHAEAGDSTAAATWARTLTREFPEDARARALVRALRR
jgi:hypothetical protein